MSRKKRKTKLGNRSKQQEPSHVKKIKSKLHEIFSVNDGNSYGYRDLIRKLQIRDKKSKEYLKNHLFSLEAKEKIEAIRFLEYGKKIKMVETAVTGIEIDTPEDLEKARKAWK